MRKIVIILSVLALVASSCGQATKKQAESKNNEVAEKQEETHRTIVQEENDNNSAENEEERFRQISLDEKIGKLTLKDYLLDEKIPQFFKDVIQQKQRLSDDEKTFALIDSLFSTDKERHPFYFVLVTRALWRADGALAEPLGMAVREYVESNTQQFLDYFSTEIVLTQFDFKHWARSTLYEILIDSDDNIEECENTRKLMKKNCNECSSEKIKMIDKFTEYMYAEYNEIQRRNKEWEKKNL